MYNYDPISQQGNIYAGAPNVMPQMSQENMISLQMKYEETRIETSARMCILEAEAYQKKQIENYKAYIAKQLMAAREEYRRKRENMMTAIVCDSEKYLRREIRYEDEVRLSRPVCQLHNFKVVRYTSLEAGEGDFVFEISAEGLQRPILLNSKVFNTKSLKEELTKQGIQICVPQRDKQNVLEGMLNFLAQDAEEVELPFTTGWCLTTERWKFAREPEKTFLGKWDKTNSSRKAYYDLWKKPREETMVKGVEIILRSLAVNAPLIKAWNMNLSRCIFLSTYAGEDSKLIDSLSETPLIIYSSMSLKEATEKVRKSNSEAVILRLPTQKIG